MGWYLHGKINIYFFTENINSELYINILKDKLPEIKIVEHKNCAYIQSFYFSKR